MSEHPPLGRIVTAMVTPMHADGSIDLAGTARLARHLVESGNDGLVVNGTTGESATTSDAEKLDILRAVLDEVGADVVVMAGVGSNDTAHTITSARAAKDLGAHALLVVTPYYNRPPQAGVAAHFEAVADATDLPLVVYDIPARSGIPIDYATMRRLAEHPSIVGVKDAKGDLWQASRLMCDTDLAWYSGDDAANLAHLTQGAVGIISVVAHVAAASYVEMIDAVQSGDLAAAIAVHRRLIPVVEAIMNTSQGAITSKAALVELGILAHATVRLPLVEGTPEHETKIRAALTTV